MEAFLLGKNYLVAFAFVVVIGFVVVVIGFVVVVIGFVVVVIGFVEAFAVVAAKLDVAPATSVPATRSVTSTFFMVCLSIDEDTRCASLVPARMKIGFQD
jgi:hypothetical protein